MKLHIHLHLAPALLLLFASPLLHAQAAVVGATDSDALFRSADPVLNANKQATYHIIKDLLEAGHWELADKYLTERYVQHNPNAGSGRNNLVKYMTEIVKVKPRPIPEKIGREIVSVVAEGDLLTVAEVSRVTDPATGKAYTTTWFNMWRFKDGKADEHWDSALLGKAKP